MLSSEKSFVGVTQSDFGSDFGSNLGEVVQELLNPEFLRSENWRKIVNQVESALCREDRSRQALDQLQQLATEQGASTQFLLKSVIRETIRLTLECCHDVSALFKRHSPLSLVTNDPGPTLADLQNELKLDQSPTPQPSTPQPSTPQSSTPQPVLTSEQQEAQADAVTFAAIGHALTPPVEKSLIDRLKSAPGLKSKPSAAELAHQEMQQALETREQSLRTICAAVHEHRQRLDMSLAQIHTSTFIPVHHLQALDEGHIDRLPEDVYLRGFLRRLEKEFELVEGELTKAMPKPQTDRRVVNNPYSSGTPTAKGFAPGLPAFSPNYAYLAYTALMAGGICLVAQQGAPKSNLPPIKIDTPQPPVSGPNTQKTSSQKVQHTQAQLNHHMAMPEVFV